MNVTTDDIYQELRALPESKLLEVKQFIEFLKYKKSVDTQKSTHQAPIENAVISDDAQVAVGLEALKIFQQNNFVGCLHEESDLSVNYKQTLDWSDKL
ncbi:hypothetical protein [Candidatus Albibeggiatoa sp. nov. NOAA]|uniref:hypothetical protein n=1 Tax=Candidatus Albibeggiatoa sp. nov. NOAA TaxID=3162724 RepID=UPI003301829E|nr:DUF2281 domain-containing protein [Thiotrichaceae bacterium]